MFRTSKASALLLGSLLAGCANLEPPAGMVTVPDKLKPGANESLPSRGIGQRVGKRKCEFEFERR